MKTTNVVHMRSRSAMPDSDMIYFDAEGNYRDKAVEQTFLDFMGGYHEIDAITLDHYQSFYEVFYKRPPQIKAIGEFFDLRLVLADALHIGRMELLYCDPPGQYYTRFSHWRDDTHCANKEPARAILQAIAIDWRFKVEQFQRDIESERKDQPTN